MLGLAACDDEATPAPVPDAGPAAPDAAPDARAFVAVTFNSGTSGSAGVPGDAYGAEQAAANDEWYGNGLAWTAFIAETAVFFADVDPDVVAFQEIFWPGDCPDIPTELHPGFVCEGWAEGDRTVVERVLGGDYQVACHPDHPDKCAAVHRRFGRFRGCDAPFCLEGLTGFEIDGCGHGARVARGVIEREAGEPLTLVTVHGTSGLSAKEAECRTRQVEQVFVDLGDGDPGANGADGGPNLVLGDLNTDPLRFIEFDASARRWNDFVGPERPFRFLTDDTPTYGPAAIDHVVSDTLRGTCTATAEVSDAGFFDHQPIVCELTATAVTSPPRPTPN